MLITSTYPSHHFCVILHLTDILFSENLKRVERSQELISDITGIQRNVALNSDRMEAADAGIQSTLDLPINKNHISSYSKLESKILDVIPPEERNELMVILN